MCSLCLSLCLLVSYHSPETVRQAPSLRTEEPSLLTLIFASNLVLRVGAVIPAIAFERVGDAATGRALELVIKAGGRV